MNRVKRNDLLGPISSLLLERKKLEYADNLLSSDSNSSSGFTSEFISEGWTEEFSTNTWSDVSLFSFTFKVEYEGGGNSDFCWLHPHDSLRFDWFVQGLLYLDGSNSQKYLHQDQADF